MQMQSCLSICLTNKKVDLESAERHGKDKLVKTSGAKPTKFSIKL
jgi:hypothetical protein